METIFNLEKILTHFLFFWMSKKIVESALRKSFLVNFLLQCLGNTRRAWCVTQLRPLFDHKLLSRGNWSPCTFANFKYIVTFWKFLHFIASFCANVKNSFLFGNTVLGNSPGPVDKSTRRPVLFCAPARSWPLLVTFRIAYLTHHLFNSLEKEILDRYLEVVLKGNKDGLKVTG